MLAEVIRTNCKREKNSKAHAINIIQVTFKDLQKLVQSQSSLEQNQLGTRSLTTNCLIIGEDLTFKAYNYILCWQYQQNVSLIGLVSPNYCIPYLECLHITHHLVFYPKM